MVQHSHKENQFPSLVSQSSMPCSSFSRSLNVGRAFGSAFQQLSIVLYLEQKAVQSHLSQMSTDRYHLKMKIAMLFIGGYKGGGAKDVHPPARSNFFSF